MEKNGGLMQVLRAGILSGCLLLFRGVSATPGEFPVTAFGAAGDGKTINTASIQRAITTCYEQGGGSVIIPAGVFLTGTLSLKSRVNLVLQPGAVLMGSSVLSDYRSDSLPGYGRVYYGILYTENAEQVSITGQGTIDGNEEAFFNWNQAKKIEWGGTRFTRQKDSFRKVTAGIGDGPVVPFERPRQMVIFSNCKKILIRDVSLNKSPFWTLHLADCDDAVISGVRILTSPLTPNSDGLDLTSCRNIRVSDCNIRTGDDAIAITGYAAHFELPGFKNIRQVSENITVTNCTLQSSSSGIRIGFLDQNPIRNVQISNCTITGSNRGIGIFVRDEGSIENISVANLTIETRLFSGDWWGNGEPIHISAVRGRANGPLGRIRGVTFRDIFCSGESGLLVFGSEESAIEDLKFENVNLTLSGSGMNSTAGGNIDLRGCLKDSLQLFSHDLPGLLIRYGRNITVSGFSLVWSGDLQPWHTWGIEAELVQDLEIRQFHGSSAPGKKGTESVLLRKVNGVKTDLPKGKSLIMD